MDFNLSCTTMCSLDRQDSCPLVRPSQDRTWFASETIQTSERTWATQPVGELCQPCGKAVASCPGDPEEVLASCRSCRTKRAEIMLLGQIQSGLLPQDSRPRLVKTSAALSRTVRFHDIRFLQRFEMFVLLQLARAQFYS